MDERQFREELHQWSLNNPHYYTDGTRFFKNRSYRKARTLIPVGRFSSAKEARDYFEWTLQIWSRV